MCAKRTLEQQEGSVQLRSRLGTTRDMGGKPSILPGCCAFKTFPQLFYRLYQLACKGFHTSCLRGPHGSNDLSPSFGRGPSLHYEPLHVGMIEDLGAAESRHPTRLAVRKGFFWHVCPGYPDAFRVIFGASGLSSQAKLRSCRLAACEPQLNQASF